MSDKVEPSQPPPAQPTTTTANTTTAQGNNHGYQGTRNNNSVLWLGDIDPEMDEDFIEESFRLLNVKTTYVKVIRDHDTGAPMGYAFVGFDKEEIAKRVLEEFNGQPVPNSGVGRKFKMNTAGKNHYSRYRQPGGGYRGGYASPNHLYRQPFNDDNNSHRPRSHFNNHNSHFQTVSAGPLTSTDGSTSTVPPPLSSTLYPSNPAAVIDTTSIDATTTANNSSPLSSLSAGPSPAPNGTTTVNVANSSSGASSGPVSGGSSVGKNTPICVDNWNPIEGLTSSQESGGVIGNWNSEESSSSTIKGSQESSVSTFRGTQENNHRGTEYTAFVGSLDYSITSEVLESTFKQRYPSVTSGKVIFEESGQSKGFGFVRFSSQVEYKAALSECSGFAMFGTRGIRISEAHPKPPRSHYAGSVTSGDGGNYFRNPRPMNYGRGGQPDNAVSNGGHLIHPPNNGGGGKHGGGKGGLPRSNLGDNPNFDQQKRLAQMEAIAQVRNWYPSGGQQTAQGNTNPNAAGRPAQSPRQHTLQQMVQGVAGMDLTGAPIILPSDGCNPGYPYWTPTGPPQTYGQPIPTGYPNPMDQYNAAAAAAAVAGQPAYWATNPNGQPIIWAADPNQVYAGLDYSGMSSGQVPTPYPRIPYNEQTAHMFAPQALVQAAAAQQPPTGNNGMMHQHSHYLAGAGGDIPPNVMTGPGGPTPPSDNEHGMIPVSGNGWTQN